MKTIRWVTPRIRYTEIIDSFGEFFYELVYNVWDFSASGDTFRIIRQEIELGTYQRFMKAPWFVSPSKDPAIEERHFYNVTMGREETLSPNKVQQFIRNFISIWHWRPNLKDLVLADLGEFEVEDPKYRFEFERWYRAERQSKYRRPHFYKDFLATTIPMGEDET